MNAPNATSFNTPPPPFNKKKGGNPAPQAQQQAPPQAPPAPQQAPPPGSPAQQQAETPAEAPKQKQKKNNVMINSEHIKFVLKNIKTMNYTEIAEKLGITKNQVNRVLQTLKGGIDQNNAFYGLRGKALQAAQDAGSQAYGLKENGKPDFTQPVSELAQKVEAKIEAELSRPADSRPGAGRKGGGAVKQALDSQLDELLAGL